MLTLKPAINAEPQKNLYQLHEHMHVDFEQKTNTRYYSSARHTPETIATAY